MIVLQYVWIRNYETLRVIPTHEHSCYEIIYYLKGHGRGSFDSVNYEYDASNFALIAPDTPHSESHDSLTSMISIGFKLENHFAEPQSCILKDTATSVFDVIQNIRHEFKGKKPYYKETIENYIGILLTEILRRTQSATVSNQNSIDYAISYIKEYYMTNLNSEQLAKSVGYCEDYFRNVFKQKTGCSPKAYIMEIRIQAAKKLLEENSCPLTEIALRCGYEYYSQFSLCFKKKTGLSPSEYREQALAKQSNETPVNDVSP